MGLQLPLADVYGDVHPEGYRRLEDLIIKHSARLIRIVFLNFRSQADSDAGLPPIGRVERRIEAAPTPAMYDGKTLISPAIPGYDQFWQADAANPTGVKASAYGLEKLFPESATAKDV